MDKPRLWNVITAWAVLDVLPKLCREFFEYLGCIFMGQIFFLFMERMSWFIWVKKRQGESLSKVESCMARESLLNGIQKSGTVPSLNLFLSFDGMNDISSDKCLRLCDDCELKDETSCFKEKRRSGPHPLVFSYLDPCLKFSGQEEW